MRWEFLSLNHLPMTYLLSNICTKNYWNWTTTVKIIVGLKLSLVVGWYTVLFSGWHSVVTKHNPFNCCGLGIIIGQYRDGQQPGNCRLQVERIRDYLLQSSYWWTVKSISILCCLPYVYWCCLLFLDVSFLYFNASLLETTTSCSVCFVCVLYVVLRKKMNLAEMILRALYYVMLNHVCLFCL